MCLSIAIAEKTFTLTISFTKLCPSNYFPEWGSIVIIVFHYFPIKDKY